MAGYQAARYAGRL